MGLSGLLHAKVSDFSTEFSDKLLGPGVSDSGTKSCPLVASAIVLGVNAESGSITENVGQIFTFDKEDPATWPKVTYSVQLFFRGNHPIVCLE